jgi:hypothetical protein
MLCISFSALYHDGWRNLTLKNVNKRKYTLSVLYYL